MVEGQAVRKFGRKRPTARMGGPTSARTGGWLAPDALVVVEEAIQSEFAPPAGFTELERRRYDPAELIVLQLAGA